ncbi:dynein light chain Tctex-type protein 2B-like [Symsagittifera roscoffensis]|uniref:dynein light chain Tctex-type protein 2B-like n=1 Tax=Symsagittifera roscoffensis TaxID=84072 RepID=UPI00307B271A
MDTAQNDEVDFSGNTFVIRPNFKHKFRPVAVREVINSVLSKNLTDKTYNAEEVADLTKTLSESIKEAVKELGYDRYRLLVQVVIGEQKGEGVKMGCRCFWDADTDNYAQDTFMNDSLFCVAAVFGLFYY